jgi:hypothetical protein
MSANQCSRLHFLYLSPFALDNAMQCNAMQCNAMQCNAMQCNAMQCNAMQCNAVQFSAVQSWELLDFLTFLDRSGGTMHLGSWKCRFY